MKSQRLPLSICVCILVLVAFGPKAYASDPTTADCLAASESSLALRNQHKLRETRARLLICSATTCPADIRDECIRRVAEVNASMPTVVFEIKDAVGNDLSAVKVTIDRESLVDRLEGTALSIDPGKHVFTFDTIGQQTIQKEFVIREGEKDRRERIVFGMTPPLPENAVPSAAASPVLVAGASTSPELPTEGPYWSHKRIGAVAAAGIGVVGIAIGVGFGLSSLSKHNEAAAACSTALCNQHGVDLWNSARSAGNISTVGFIVGAAGLAGGAAIWFFSKPRSGESRKTAVGLGLGTVQWKGTW